MRIVLQIQTFSKNAYLCARVLAADCLVSRMLLLESQGPAVAAHLRFVWRRGQNRTPSRRATRRQCPTRRAEENASAVCFVPESVAAAHGTT